MIILTGWSVMFLILFTQLGKNCCSNASSSLMYVIVYNVVMQAVSNDSCIVLPSGSQAIGCEDQVSQSGGNDIIVLLYGGLISRWGIFKIH